MMQNKDKFYTSKQGKRFKPNTPQQVIAPKELCKFFLTGSCHRGAQCTYSHNLSDYPCKYLHATGSCEKGDLCKFSHKIFQSVDEINRFIDDNEQFLNDLLRDKGKTNLGDYFINRQREKDDARARQQMQNVMIPQSMLGSQDFLMGNGGQYRQNSNSYQGFNSAQNFNQTPQFGSVQG